MLTERVCHIVYNVDVEESKRPRCDGLAYTMKAEHHVALVDPGMR